MRMQVRFEIAEGYGDLVSRYNREQRTRARCCKPSTAYTPTLAQVGTATGLYLRHLLHAYFIWNPRIHHQSTGL